MNAARERVWQRAVVHVALLVALSLATSLFQLGSADWEDDSESCGGQIVQEMVGGAGWIMPLRNERHIPVKPPLFYWLGALTATLRHTSGDIFDTRAPSAALGALCVVSVYLFGRWLGGDLVGLWAALMLIATPQFIIEARNSRVDIALCAFLTAALFLAFRVWEGAGARRSAVLAGLCVGLATLSKGPLALALTMLVLGGTLLVAPPKPTWRALLSPWALAAAVGVPALWYAAATLEHGMPFLRVHFYDENVSRLLGQQGSYAWWWYAEPLITGGLPWMLALPWMVRGESALPPRARRFLWVWTVGMLVLFSLSPGKRRAYLLVLRPALAVLLAGWLVPQLTRWREGGRAATLPRAVYGAIGAVVAAGLACILVLRAGVGGFGASELQWSHWWRAYLQQYTGTAFALVLGLGVGAVLLARWGAQRRFDLAAYALAGTMAWGVTLGVAAGAIVRGNGASFRELAHAVAAQVPPTEPLAFVDLDDDKVIAFLFYLHRHVPVVTTSVDAPCTPPRPGAYLMFESRWEREACGRDPRWHELLRGGPPAESQRWRRLVLARYAGDGR